MSATRDVQLIARDEEFEDMVTLDKYSRDFRHAALLLDRAGVDSSFLNASLSDIRERLACFAGSLIDRKQAAGERG
jgi:hypothetical protein